jgi:pimeloyl-ACP methyl ester carboxylesterase
MARYIMVLWDSKPLRTARSDGMDVQGRLDRGDGVELAWARLPGRGPVVVFLPGFASDMSGAKALAVRDFCAASGQAMLRLDYAGHGASGGRFEDGTIGRWTEDAAAVIEAQAAGDVLLVGSSMGGWIGLLLARRLGARVVGLIGIAAAPDFTESLMWDSMLPAERARLLAGGRIEAPSDYGAPLVITRALIEDGREHLLLGGPIAITCPVRLLQGRLDPDVPWETALKLSDRLDSTDVQVTLIKDGDHRLSRPHDIGLLTRTLAALLGEDGGQA